MNPLARLRKLRQAQRLYNQLVQGETTLLVEYFPFVEMVFTPKIVAPAPQPPPEPEMPPALPESPATKKPVSPPRISFRSRSEEDDLRDALDIGFGTLKFDAVKDEEK